MDQQMAGAARAPKTYVKPELRSEGDWRAVTGTITCPSGKDPKLCD